MIEWEPADPLIFSDQLRPFLDFKTSECRRVWDQLQSERNYAPQSIDENRVFSNAAMRRDWLIIRLTPANGWNEA